MSLLKNRSTRPFFLICAQ